MSQDPGDPGDEAPDEPVGRLPPLTPAVLEPHQRELYSEIVGGPRASGPLSLMDRQQRLLGPFNALLHAPGIGAAVEQLGAALRFRGAVAARTRELVICAVSAHWGSAFEWYAHSKIAADVGVTPEELQLVRAGQIPDGLAAEELVAMRFARALLEDRQVDRSLYDEVVGRHGPAGLVELSVLVGHYQLLAGLLAADDVPAPDGVDPFTG